MERSLFYTYDEYGVKNYRNVPILVLSFVIFLMIVYVAGNILLQFELPAENENVTNLHDAIWLVYMAASTIGFGDFYPVTTGGRVIVGSMFLVGAVMLGIIIGLVHNIVMGWLETGVKNRELRANVASLQEHNEKLETVIIKLNQKLDELHEHNKSLYEHNETLYVHNQSIEKKVDSIEELLNERGSDRSHFGYRQSDI